ncbi:hypothetical protein [Flavobacterium sp. JP2137]
MQSFFYAVAPRDFIEKDRYYGRFTYSAVDDFGRHADWLIKPE